MSAIMNTNGELTCGARPKITVVRYHLDPWPSPKPTPACAASLATGTGKTFIACHLLKRIADARQLKRALFLCDRDELRTQGLKAMQGVFGADAAEVHEENEERNHAKNARVHIAI